MNSHGMLHLLWKDWRQVQRAFWIVVGMLGLLQVFLVFSFLFRWQYVQDILRYNPEVAFQIAFCPSIFLGVIFSAFLIGQERQERVWNWSSSLPVAWQKSFASKLSLWVILSLISTLALLVLASLGPSATRVGIGVTAPTAQSVCIVAINTSIIAIECVLLFSLLLLLISEPLLAMLIAGLSTAFIHVLLGGLTYQGIWVLWIDAALLAPDDAFINQTWASTLFLAFLGILIVANLIAYRWRWQTGQYVVLQPFRRRTSPLIEMVPNTSWINSFSGVAQPSIRRAIHSNALRSGFVARVVIFAAVILAMTCSRFNSETLGMYYVLSVGSSLFLGLTTFAFDQTDRRYRFWADRGLEPRQFLTSRMFQSSGLCLLLIIIGFGFACSEVVDVTQLVAGKLVPAQETALRGQFVISLRGVVNDFSFEIIPLSACFYLTGVLASLCFPNAIAAFGVAAIKLWSDFFFFLIVAEIFAYQTGTYPWFAAYWFLIGITLMVGIGQLAKKWLVQDRFAGPAWFSAVAGIAAIVSILGVLATILLRSQLIIPH